MEKVFQEYAGLPDGPKYNLVRYGNVLGSTGSVIQVWRKMEEESGEVYATDPDMTRFWLTVDQAVDIILMALQPEVPSGWVVIPECQATSMADLADYVLNENTPVTYTGLRPGEKRYEELLGKEESLYARKSVVEDWIFLAPTTTEPVDEMEWEFNSADCPRFTKEEILDMIGE